MGLFRLKIKGCQILFATSVMTIK